LKTRRADLKPPPAANRAANKVPLTDEELQRIIRACDQLEPVPWKNHMGQACWTGEGVKAFIWMRILNIGWPSRERSLSEAHRP